MELLLLLATRIFCAFSEADPRSAAKTAIKSLLFMVVSSFGGSRRRAALPEQITAGCSPSHHLYNGESCLNAGRRLSVQIVFCQMIRSRSTFATALDLEWTCSLS